MLMSADWRRAVVLSAVDSARIFLVASNVPALRDSAWVKMVENAWVSGCTSTHHSVAIQWLHPVPSDCTPRPVTAPCTQWLHPAASDCTHHSVTAPCTQWLHHALSDCTLPPVTAPCSQWLHPPLSGCTMHPVTTPCTQWLHPAPSDCTHHSVAVPSRPLCVAPILNDCTLNTSAMTTGIHLWPLHNNKLQDKITSSRNNWRQLCIANWLYLPHSLLDVNECTEGIAHQCTGQDQICINTRGGYKCNTVQCPRYFSLASESLAR